LLLLLLHLLLVGLLLLLLLLAVLLLSLVAVVAPVGIAHAADVVQLQITEAACQRTETRGWYTAGDGVDQASWLMLLRCKSLPPRQCCIG